MGIRRKKKTKTGMSKARISSARKRQLLIFAAVAGGSFMLAAGGAVGYVRLEQQVEAQMLADSPHPTFHFIDMPEQVTALASGDLDAALQDMRGKPWTQPDFCAQTAQRLEKTGWIAALRHVRRLPAGRFEIGASYRKPAALVQYGSDFYLVDWEGVRLPGAYVFHPNWKVIQGVSTPRPAAGQLWDAPDLKTGLDVLAAIRNEAFVEQVTAILVHNHAGRQNPRGSHVELATDRPGGRILWGSAPGREVEENLVAQKLTILRETYRRTGRVDAGYTTLDVSTFPDRFTVPN